MLPGIDQITTSSGDSSVTASGSAIPRNRFSDDLYRQGCGEESLY